MSHDSYHALIKEPQGDAPLVFAFHGTGGDENQFFGLAQQLLPDAGVVSPRGDVSEMEHVIHRLSVELERLATALASMVGSKQDVEG